MEWDDGQPGEGDYNPGQAYYDYINDQAAQHEEREQFERDLNLPQGEWNIGPRRRLRQFERR